MGRFLFLPILPAFRGRDGYRLAFDVRSKAFARDSRVQAALSRCQRVDRSRCGGGIQIPSSHPAEGGTDSSNLSAPTPKSTVSAGLAPQVAAYLHPYSGPLCTPASMDSELSRWEPAKDSPMGTLSRLGTPSFCRLSARQPDRPPFRGPGPARLLRATGQGSGASTRIPF